MSDYKNPIDIHLKVKSLPSLCFDKDDFLLNEFCIDRFISECRKHASLDTMRDDLNMYHKMLCTAMIELLNKDYTDFVNLSSNLAGLDKSLKNLSLPLQKLKKEMEIIKTTLDETLHTVTELCFERVSNHDAKVSVYHLLSVEDGLENLCLMIETDHNPHNIQILERIAFTFNNVQYHMHKTNHTHKNYAYKEELLTNVAKNLEQKLQDVFLQNLSTGVLFLNNSIDNNQKLQDLQKILRICSVMSEERKLENGFQCFVVRPFMKKLVTQSNITKLGLEKLLHEILDFIPNACSDVLKLTTKGINKDIEIVPGYDFLVNAVWPEIMNSFELISPVYLYSLGDPQQFHQKYCSVMKFLDQFEHLCEVQSSVVKLRKLSSYKEFLQKFNLDVYFQIRFQEIAGQFELDLFEDGFAMSPNDKCLPYTLKATVSLWCCLNLCWSDAVFLPFLRKEFFKLTIQLLSRYNFWAISCIKEIKNEKTLELALLIKDVEAVKPELRRFFLEVIQQKLCYGNAYACEDITERAFRDAEKSLHEIPGIASKLIVKIFIEKCSIHLKMISSIPQRYRKTNREIPSKPSPYVAQVLNPLTEFSLETNSILPSEWRYYIEREVTDAIMKQSVTLMQDVLTSIKKMEDSLKILKRARDKSTGQFSHGFVTDDDKIRRQLAIDVAHFEELILKSDLQTTALKSLSELRHLIASADRIPCFPNGS